MRTPRRFLPAAFFLVFAAAGALAAPPSAGQAADPSADSQRKAVAELLRAMDQAAASRDFDKAMGFARAAHAAAVKTGDRALIDEVLTRGRQTLARQKEAERTKAAQEPDKTPLADGPPDPGDAAGRARLADEFWKRAEGANETDRSALIERAEYWYRKALPGLSGLARAKAVQRLAVIRSGSKGAASTAAKSPGAWGDVVAQLRVDRDVLSGECRIADGRLECQTASRGNPRVAFPIVPSGSYDLQLRLLRKADGAVGIVLPVRDKLCALAINIGAGLHGIDMIDGRRAADNASTVKAALNLDRPYQLEISVRVDGAQAAITTTLDGRPWVYYRGPLAALSLHDDWQYRQRAPGLVVQSAATFANVMWRER